MGPSSGEGTQQLSLRQRLSCPGGGRPIEQGIRQVEGLFCDQAQLQRLAQDQLALKTCALDRPIEGNEEIALPFCCTQSERANNGAAVEVTGGISGRCRSALTASQGRRTASAVMSQRWVCRRLLIMAVPPAGGHCAQRLAESRTRAA